MTRYQPPKEVPGALRLHLNENTGGCSPAVLEAIRRVTAEQAAVYPDYEPLARECAAHLAVPPTQLVLTNGLDEGHLCLVVASFRASQSGVGPPEGIIVLPAFEMYAIQIRATGGRVVQVPSRADFDFPTEEVLHAVTPRTRVIFLTSPNNPTGRLIPHGVIRDIARSVPPEVTIALDEAYYEFSGTTFVPEIAQYPNVIVGRTFAKAYGLAGLRAGCLIGDESRIEPIRDVVPPYNVSVLTAAGWRAALADGQHLAWYQQEVAASKRLVYDCCERLGLKYWQSAGNFVLIRIGDDVEGFVSAMAARGVLVKDRSHEHGCQGCVRITAGVVQHTQRALAALEEILCAAQ